MVENELGLEFKKLESEAKKVGKVKVRDIGMVYWQRWRSGNGKEEEMEKKFKADMEKTSQWHHAPMA